MAAEVLDALTKRTQDGGTEVVQAKAGKVRQRGGERGREQGVRGARGCVMCGRTSSEEGGAAREGAAYRGRQVQASEAGYCQVLGRKYCMGVRAGAGHRLGFLWYTKGCRLRVWGPSPPRIHTLPVPYASLPPIAVVM